MDNGISDVKMCWICHEEGPDDEGKPLMHGGCLCCGSLGYCHSTCWINFAKAKTLDSVLNGKEVNREAW